MSSIRRRNGKYQVQVRRKGFPAQTRTFILLSDAKRWARRVEAELDRGPAATPVSRTVLVEDLLTRYRDEITPRKRGAEQETIRIDRLIRDDFSSESLATLTPDRIARFRDRRIKDGTRTCLYDLVLLRHVLQIARFEWGYWLPENPVDFIAKPKQSKPRERRLIDDEYGRLAEAATKSRSIYIWPLVNLALETAMRRSELLSIRWDHIDWIGRTMLIELTLPPLFPRF